MNIELKNKSHSLSNYELNVLLPILKKGLEKKNGRINAVKGKQIIEGLKSHGLKISERQMQRLINHIRMNDLIAGLMASSKGYYISCSAEELMDYENRLLSREEAIKEVRMSIERQRKILYSQLAQRQTQLF